MNCLSSFYFAITIVNNNVGCHQLLNIYICNFFLCLLISINSLYINYSSFELRLFLWGNRRSRVNILQKRAIRAVNFSPYISHSEPIFKNLKLLNMKDLFTLKKFKFLYQLAHNTLPTHFNSYRQFFIKKTLLTIYVIMPCHCRELIMCLQKKSRG